MFRRKDENSPEFQNESAEAVTASATPTPAPANSNNSFVRPAAMEPARPVVNPMPTASAAPATPVSPFRPVAEPLRARQMEQSRPSAPPAPYGSTSTTDKTPKANRRVLTVGNDILMRGEITNCDRFVIEGQVDAKVSSVHTMELAESGSFKGIAEVEEAEISGVLEGELIVRGRLVIYATGKVRGKVTYGEIEIERGGEITGEIKTMAGAGANATAASSSRQGRSGEERHKKLEEAA